MTDGTLRQQMATTHLLIVDDEPTIRTALVRAFTLLGYSADAAASGEEALRRLEATPYEGMVLDLQMPGIHGLEVMRQARAHYPRLLILILTGHATLDSAIEAVRAEAVDYLLKPVGVREVTEAVERAVTKRARSLQQAHLMEVLHDTVQALRAAPIPEAPPHTPAEQAQTFLLDQERRAVRWGRGGPLIALTEGEFAILRVFVTHPNRVLACRDLVWLAWGEEQVESTAQGIIRPYISRLRAKLEPQPDAPHLLHTVRGRGYRFSPTEEA